MKRAWLFSAAAGVGVLLMASSPALAQAPAPAPSPPHADGSDVPPADNNGDEDKKNEARQRYQRGLQIYGEGNYDAARVEFERAYQLNPSYKILYNIGLSYEQLGDYVQALTILRRYLGLGGNDITPERRADVEKELAQIRPRIAKATVIMNTTGVEVLVDDGCATEQETAILNCGATLGTTRQVLMNPGRRRITGRKGGFLPETQIVTVAGSDSIEVRLDLKPLAKDKKETNPWTIPMAVGWGLTGAAGVFTVVAGVHALSLRKDQRNDVAAFGATRPELDDAKSQTNKWGEISDYSLIGTGVLALVSGYLTYRQLKWKPMEPGPLKVQVGWTGNGVSGTF
jgi:tetratricopeptide (TPR) repeat protein